MNRVQTHRTSDGFTLVELLVTISVIAVLGSMVTVALNGATKQANQTRTDSMIGRLNLTVLELYERESYRNVSAAVGFSDEGSPDLAAKARNSRSLATLNWKRDYLRVAFPDSIVDVIDPPVGIRYEIFTPTLTRAVSYVDTDTSFTTTPIRSVVQDRIRSRVVQLITAKRLGDDPSATVPANFAECVDDFNGPITNDNGEWTIEHQSSECLYLILATNIVNDAPATEILRGREIDDTDNDGVPEVLDAWGVPVAFIRWPAGFYLHSSWLPVPPTPTPPPGTALTDEQLSAVKQELDRDPLDILNVDPRTIDTSPTYFTSDDPYLMVPMVLSAGEDEEFDIFGLDTPSTYRYVDNTFADMDGFNGGSGEYPHTLAFTGDDSFIDPYTHDQSSSVPTYSRYGVRMDSNDGGRGDGADNSADNIYPTFNFQ